MGMLDGVLDLPTVRRAKEDALRLLRHYGIDDDFTIKLKPTKQENWLAQYRATSQFRSGTIFWVNPEHPADHDELVRTILHEYGHVIYELARFRVPELHAEIDRMFYDDEEEFAEEFGRAVFGMKDYPWLRQVTTAYMAFLKG